MPDFIQNAPLLLAALLSGLTTCLHVFAGGPEAARPLLRATDIPDQAKYTNYHCWHLATITLLAMTAGFLGPALGVGDAAGALLWAATAGAFALWCVGLAVWRRLPARSLPQWALFAPISALGFWGAL